MSFQDAIDEILTRREHESLGANRALLDYVNMLPSSRSVRTLHQRYVELDEQRARQEAAGEKPEGLPPPTTSLGTLWTWSNDFDWPARAAQIDEIERRKRITQDSAARDAMQRRHAQLAQAAQSKVVEWLMDKATKLEKPSDVIAFLKVSTEVERRAMNVPQFVLEILSLPDDLIVARYMQLRAAPQLSAGEGETVEGEIVDEQGIPFDQFFRGDDEDGGEQ